MQTKVLPIALCIPLLQLLASAQPQPSNPSWLVISGEAQPAQGVGMPDSYLSWVSLDGNSMLVTYRSGWPASVYLTTRDQTTDAWGARQQLMVGYTSGSIGPDGYLYARPDVTYSKIARCAPNGLLAWGSPVGLGLTVPAHQNTQTFDGRNLFYAGSPSGGDGADLFASAYNPTTGTFSEGVRVDSLSDAAAEEFSPWISPDGLTMLFASDRAGGYGDYDIYCASRESTASSTWGNVSNLGPKVNTAAREDSPALAVERGVLYFNRFSTGGIQIHQIQASLIVDSDGDGVLDANDQCPNTVSGSVVDLNGCSIDQLVPCAGPASGGVWKNHGEYVSTVAKTAEEFLGMGLITSSQREAIVSQAARSDWGMVNRGGWGVRPIPRWETIVGGSPGLEAMPPESQPGPAANTPALHPPSHGEGLRASR